MSQRTWELVDVQQAVSARGPELAQALEWYWHNGPFTERHTAFIGIIRDYWFKRDDVRAVLVALRPPTPTRDEEGRWSGLMDWLALNDALRLEHETLAWFDARVADKALPLPAMHRLMRVILERGRIEDFAAFADAAETSLDFIGSIDETEERLAGLPREIVEDQLFDGDTEVAWWRLVATATAPHRVAEIDEAIKTCSRAEEISAVVALSRDQLLARMLEYVTL